MPFLNSWFSNSSNCVEILDNSVSLFSLIENLQYVTYNFTGNSYTIKREKVQEIYPNYSKINENGINKDNFNIYLENKMTDDEFIKDIFNKLFI